MIFSEQSVLASLPRLFLECLETRNRTVVRRLERRRPLWWKLPFQLDRFALRSTSDRASPPLRSSTRYAAVLLERSAPERARIEADGGFFNRKESRTASPTTTESDRSPRPSHSTEPKPSVTSRKRCRFVRRSCRLFHENSTRESLREFSSCETQRTPFSASGISSVKRQSSRVTGERIRC